MPQAFEQCSKQEGAKIRTKTLPDGRYVHGCTTDGKNWVWGEVKEKKTTLKETHEEAGK